MFAGSCKPKLKNARGLVKNVYIYYDTLKAMTVQMSEDEGDTMVFNLSEARLNNGIMMPQDSVIVEYINGRHDTARAFVVTILPKPVKYINPDAEKKNELKTVPSDSIKKPELEKPFIPTPPKPGKGKH